MERVAYRLRLGVVDDDAGFAIGADGRLTDGREDSCRELAPEIGTSIPDKLLLLLLVVVVVMVVVRGVPAAPAESDR